MKVNTDLIFGIAILIVTILVTNLVEGNSPDQNEDTNISDVYGAMKMNPREGRMWAPWTYAAPMTRGRWNVGRSVYGNSYAPNVAWDSTMSRNRRGRRSYRRHNNRRYYNRRRF